MLFLIMTRVLLTKYPSGQMCFEFKYTHKLAFILFKEKKTIMNCKDTQHNASFVLIQGE